MHWPFLQSRVHPALKDVPTMIEALGQELVYNSFFGVATTKGVPPPIVERLTKEVHAALADPGIARRLVEMGGSPSPTSSAATAIFVEARSSAGKRSWLPPGSRRS